MTYRELALVVGLTAAVAACRDESRIAPGPSSYSWPDSFAFKIEYVAETRTDSALLARYEERKELRFGVHDDQYLAWHDSLVKESLVPGQGGRAEAYSVEDTLRYYVTLDRHGRVTRSEPGCDPALPACRQALPSAIALELAPLVPRLPVWTPPRGDSWEDTITFDDTRRPGGLRGSVVTRSWVAGDTVVAGVALWKVAWHSQQRSFGPSPGASGIAAGVPVEQSGFVYVDKERELPVFAMWGGALPPPAQLEALGVKGTGFRGRAYLAGSIIERLLGPPE